MSEKEKSKQETRRSFLEGAGMLGLTAILSAVPESAQAAGNGQDFPALAKATGYNVKKWETVQTPDGREVRGVMQATGDGESASITFFARWIYSGETYTVIHHIPATRFSRGVTAIVSGTKGAIEGDFRHDIVSAVAISDDGTVHREGPSEVNVRLKNPYTGLSVQESVNQFVEDKASGRFKH